MGKSGSEICAVPSSALSGVKCCSHTSGYDRPADEDLFYDDRNQCNNVSRSGWYVDLQKANRSEEIKLIPDVTSSEFCTPVSGIVPEACRQVHGPFMGTRDYVPGQLNPMAHQRESGMAHCRSHLVKEFDNLDSHEAIHLTFHYRTYNRWGLDDRPLSVLEAEGIAVPELVHEVYTVGFDSGPSARTWSSVYNNAYRFGQIGGKPWHWGGQSKDWRGEGNEWMQLEAPKRSTVVGIAIQGRGSHTQWVKKVQIKHSLDDVTFEWVDGGRTFDANTHQEWVENIMFNTSVTTRFVRILAVEKNKQFAFRAELITPARVPKSMPHSWELYNPGESHRTYSSLYNIGFKFSQMFGNPWRQGDQQKDFRGESH